MEICVQAVCLRPQRVLADAAGVQQKVGIKGIQVNLIGRQGETLRFPHSLVDMVLLDFMIRVVDDDVAFPLAGKDAGTVHDAVDILPVEIASCRLVRIPERFFQRVGDGVKVRDVAFADASFRRSLPESEDDRISRLVPRPVQCADF